MVHSGSSTLAGTASTGSGWTLVIIFWQVHIIVGVAQAQADELRTRGLIRLVALAAHLHITFKTHTHLSTNCGHVAWHVW